MVATNSYQAKTGSDRLTRQDRWQRLVARQSINAPVDRIVRMHDAASRFVIPVIRSVESLC
jgi:hypothetical protein